MPSREVPAEEERKPSESVKKPPHDLLEAQAESKWLMQAVFDGIQDGISILDSDLNVVRANTWIEKTYTAEMPLVGRKCYEVYQKRQSPCPRCPSLAALETGEMHSEVMPYPSFEEPAGWVDLSSYPLKDADGKVVGVVEHIRDITDRKRAEDLIREQRDLGVALSAAHGLEETLRLCVETSIRVSRMDSGGVYLIDHVSGAVDLAFHQGLSPGFIRGASHYDADSVNARVIMAGKSVYTLYQELGGSPDNGKVGEGLRALAVIPIRFEDRVIACLNIASHTKDDISDLARTSLETIASGIGSAIARAKMEHALGESEERYRDLVELSPDPVLIVLDGRCRFANPAFSEVFGYTRDDVDRGLSYFDLVREQDREAARRWYEDRLAGKEVQQTYQVDLVARDRAVIPCETSVAAIQYESLPAGLVIIRDITERRCAEEERRQLEAQVQHAQKLESLGVLAGGIAHDFNNLLMGILGNAELAKPEISTGSGALDHIEAIETAARRAAELCAQMLAYSGKGRFVVRAVSLSEVVEEMAHLLEVSISRNTVFKRDLSADIPLIDADATQIRQIVLNLITNASESIGDGGGTIVLDTGVTHCTREDLAKTYLDEDLPEGDYIYMEVSDTGCGMSEETLSRIFEPFFTTKFTGRGLGLAAVLGIVRGHRGAIMVSSEPGCGTTFRVLFPPGVQPAAVAEPRIPESADLKAQGTVLVVDDEEAVRFVTRRMLEKAGFDVLTAGDGREGVRIFRDRADDIVAVILDLTMPHQAGEQTFYRLREIRSNVPVILASGYSERELSERFRGKGLAGFIQKPFGFATLTERLKKALEIVPGS
ncbi:MAG: PAS domain S-box protein [Candidatus Eisenbacteria sp.]|nr:PAS domain S-box protein [Candidatus Eisenbacteria bacterium]